MAITRLPPPSVFSEKLYTRGNQTPCPCMLSPTNSPCPVHLMHFKLPGNRPPTPMLCMPANNNKKSRKKLKLDHGMATKVRRAYSPRSARQVKENQNGGKPPEGEPAVRGVPGAEDAAALAPPASLNVSLCFFWPLRRGHILFDKVSKHALNQRQRESM